MSRRSKRFRGCDDPAVVVIFLHRQFGNIFIDIGANRGFYTLNLAKNWKKVYAFEPFVESAAAIKTKCQNAGIKNVEVRRKAILDRVGKVDFYISPRGHKCHSVLPVGDATIKVPCTTLAIEFGKRKIDLIKVDTEGTEFEVVAGAVPIIKYIKSWVIEVHDLQEICGPYATVKGTYEERCKIMQNYLKELGYNTLWISPKKTIYAWRKDEKK